MSFIDLTMSVQVIKTSHVCNYAQVRYKINKLRPNTNDTRDGKSQNGVQRHEDDATILIISKFNIGMEIL